MVARGTVLHHFIYSSDSSQIDLYIETFDLQTGKGIDGVNADTSNVDWTIDVSGNPW